MNQQGDFKNALPREVDDHPDSGMPRQLRTQADQAPTESVPEIVYGESDENPNEQDQRDAHRG